MKNKVLMIAIVLLILGFSNPAKDVAVKIDATRSYGKLKPFWASQIVHPTEFLVTEWGRNLIRLFVENGAARQYIRIYNQPEKAIRLDSNGKISYDWSHFDEMADMIISTGNKVKVVFFGMPYEIAAFPESVKKRPYGGLVCISPPKDYALWEHLCADFTRHVVNKYGLKEVKQWTFRCWNEPDLASFWHQADLKEYLKLYDYFAEGVKSVSEEIRIGGLALSGTKTYLEPGNLRFFFDHITGGINHATGSKGTVLDFFSIHTYGGSGGAGGPGRKFPEVDYLMEQQIRLADIRDEYPALKGIPIHVEEWGETSGGTTGVASRPTADVRNSQYGAAFLTTWVSRHMDILLENNRNFESFTFCASGYEIMPSEDFMGYRTLDTRNGFHKPVLNAYKFLNRLAPEIARVQPLHNDRISAIASHGKNSITVIITNYQDEYPYNDGFTYPVTLDIKTKWKPGREVLVKHWRIDENHSNSYTEFKKLGSPKLPDPIQIDRVKERMGPELLGPEERMLVRDLSQYRFELPCNSVSFVEIHLK